MFIIYFARPLFILFLNILTIDFHGLCFLYLSLRLIRMCSKLRLVAIILSFSVISSNSTGQVFQTGLNYNELSTEQLKIAHLKAHNLSESGGILAIGGLVASATGYVVSRNAASMYLPNSQNVNKFLSQSSTGTLLMSLGGTTALIGLVMRFRGESIKTSIKIARATEMTSIQVFPQLYKDNHLSMGFCLMINY